MLSWKLRRGNGRGKEEEREKEGGRREKIITQDSQEEGGRAKQNKTLLPSVIVLKVCESSVERNMGGCFSKCSGGGSGGKYSTAEGGVETNGDASGPKLVSKTDTNAVIFFHTEFPRPHGVLLIVCTYAV